MAAAASTQLASDEDWKFKESKARAVGFGIGDSILREIEVQRRAKLQFNELLITSLDGPKHRKEYSSQVKAALLDDKRPIMVFFGLLNVKPSKKFGHGGLEDEEEDRIVDMIDKHPELCQELYRFEAFPKDLLHPLHMLCALGAGSKTLKVCLKACEAAIFHDTSILGSPVHYAVSHDAPFESIKFLVKKDADSLLIQSSKNLYTPLHSGALHSCHPNTIAYLTDRCPSSAGLLDKDGNTPLHLACSVKHPVLAIVEDLTEVYPEAGEIVSGEGQIPLMCAMKRHAKPEVLNDLIVSRPDVTKYVDDDGSTILHKALVYDVDVSVLKILVKANPSMLQATNSLGNYPIHTAVQNAIQNRKVYSLLCRKYPDALEEKNKAGNTPCSYAKKKKLDVEIVEFLNPYEDDE